MSPSVPLKVDSGGLSPQPDTPDTPLTPFFSFPNKVTTSKGVVGGAKGMKTIYSAPTFLISFIWIMTDNRCVHKA